jgi:hypothetical protein
MKVNFSFVYLNFREIAGYELRVTSTPGMQSDDIFSYNLIDDVLVIIMFLENCCEKIYCYDSTSRCTDKHFRLIF